MSLQRGFIVSFCIAAAILSGTTNAIAKDVKNSFERSPKYFLPHRHNTTKKAVKIANGVAEFTIAPGMFGASSDIKNGKERAEMGIKLVGDVWVKQTFRIKVGEGFRASKRTLVAQVKIGDAKGSPAVAVYVSNKGEVKCNDYSGKQTIKRTSPKGINLTDGKWHTISMEYIRSNTDGLCRIIIDGKVILARTGYDSDPGGKELVARIGPYRDALPYSQVLFYDDWRVQSSKRTP